MVYIDFDAATLITRWEQFFETTNIVNEIRKVADFYDEKTKSVYVDFSDIFQFDVELADHLLRYPAVAIAAAEAAIEILLFSDNKPHIYFRPKGLPEANMVDVRDLGEEHINKLVAVKGIIQRWTQKEPLILVAYFSCVRCGNIIEHVQDEDILKEPLVCPTPDGCDRTIASTKFTLLNDKSKFVNLQRIQTQEPQEDLHGTVPAFVEAQLKDDLTGKLAPGFRIILNAIVRTRPKRRGTTRLTIFDKWLEVVSFEILDQPYEEIEISEEDEKAIIAESKNPDLFPHLIDSISPLVYGHNAEKEGIVLHLFGGVPKPSSDGTMTRGDIHILLVGDPAVAKSKLLRSVSHIAPRAILVTATEATGPGLTAIAVKDGFDDRWALEAGALVLADMGHACIDELDKMNENDRNHIHDAMESQAINVAKAGLIAKLYTRCAILAAANPKKGRFSEFDPIPDQITLPPTLISRFDVIYIIKDKPNKEIDQAISSHVLEFHQHFDDPKIKSQNPPFSNEFFRKYIAYAKGITPRISDAAKKIIDRYYIRLREETGSEGNETIQITARQLDALIRFAEASARVRLSKTVTKSDAYRATRIMEHYLKQVAGVSDGRYDIDLVEAGTSMDQRGRIQKIIEIIEDLSTDSKDAAANINDILNSAAECGIESKKVLNDIKHMISDGTIYETIVGSGRYRLSKG